MKAKTTMKLLLSIACSLFLNTISADEMLFKFKSPSFSGNGTSAHYLTIENQEHSRDEKIKEEIQAYKEELVRDQNNTRPTKPRRRVAPRVPNRTRQQPKSYIQGPRGGRSYNNRSNNPNTTRNAIPNRPIQSRTNTGRTSSGKSRSNQ